MRKLEVYLHTQHVGQLIQDNRGLLFFKYDVDYLVSGRIPLSHSLPLQKERFTFKQCQGFFSGILPEAHQRTMIARRLGISPHNDFAMLAKIGGECAGAVTFLPEGSSPEKQQALYHALSDDELAHILKTLPHQPLMAGQEGVRLSLAGVQDKIAVHILKNTVSLPLNGAPSTHILKPALPHFPGVVFNEAFCLKLAKIVGLPAASAEVHTIEDIDYLCVERYDRIITQNNIERIHQEDFCQALGITSNMKYQIEGGPSLKRCFHLLREISTVPALDLQCLLDAVVFNYFIGNHDAHGKNFSIVYYSSHNRRLAPFYDLLCTRFYPELSCDMAMKIGGEYSLDKISIKHFESLAEDIGFSTPMVKKRIFEMVQTIQEALHKVDLNHPTSHRIAEIIQNRSRVYLATA